MGMEEMIATLREDMREIKDAVKHLTEAFIAMEKRIISNEKDFEAIIREYARTGAQLEDLKKYVTDQDQHIWNEVRAFRADCKECRAECKESCSKTLEQSKAEVKKDIRLWLFTAIVSAVGAVVFTIVSKWAGSIVK